MTCKKRHYRTLFSLQRTAWHGSQVDHPSILVKPKSSHQSCSIKKGILKNFVKYTRKHLYPATFLKISLWHRCFLVNFSKFVRTPLLENISGSCFCSKATKLAMKTLERKANMLPLKFAKVSKQCFNWTTLNDCFCRLKMRLSNYI